jgi:hypothetical protein
MKAIIPIFIFALLASVSTAAALGLSPVKTSLEFVPGLEEDFTFNIINNENRSIGIILSADGELKDYISIAQPSFQMDKDQYYGPTSFSLSLPESLPPGKHEGTVSIKEFPIDTGGSGQINVLFVLGHRVIVNVPYPAKYIEADIAYIEGDEHDDISVLVDNLGTDEIDSLSLRLEVYENDNLIKFVESEESSIPSGERREFSVSLKKVEQADYLVKADLEYDGTLKRLSRTIAMQAGAESSAEPEPVPSLVHRNISTIEEPSTEAPAPENMPEAPDYNFWYVVIVAFIFVTLVLLKF